MNEKDQKLQRILELAKIADTLTNTQAKQFVEHLVGLTNKQKEELVKKFNEFADNVSQETHSKITEAIAIVSEKHKDAMLEVRQLTNKQKKAHEDRMQELQDIILELQSIEIRDGVDGKDGIDGKDGKDGSPDTAEQVRDKLETLKEDERLDVSAIKGLDFVNKTDLQNAISMIPRNGGGSGGIEVFNSTGKVGSGSALKFIGSGVSSITNDGHTTTVNLSGGGGGTWGSITGTLSDQTDLQNALDAKQDTLVSGTNIKTVNGTSLLGSGDISISGVGTGTANTIAYWDTTTSIASLDTATYPSLTELSYVKGVTAAIQTQLNTKQATLVSGTNIKTINGSSLLGSGDLSITGGWGTTGTIATLTGTSTLAMAGFSLTFSGGNISSPGAGSNSEKFGASATSVGADSVAFGKSASAASQYNLAIGASASATDTNSVAIGALSTASSGGFAFGRGASATATNAMTFGVNSSNSGVNSITIGNSNSVSTNNTILLGVGAVGVGTSIAIGTGAETTASNQLVVGTSGGSGMFISNVFFGNGVTATTPQAYTINGSGGSGTNVAGGNITIAGGKGTGNANGGSIIFSTSDAGGSGATLQSLTEKVRITPAGLLTFQGTSSSFPAIKRSSAILQARLADDSAYTDIEVADEAYGSGWNGSLEVPTKNAVYDKLQTMVGGYSLVSYSTGTSSSITVSSLDLSTDLAYKIVFQWNTTAAGTNGGGVHMRISGSSASEYNWVNQKVTWTTSATSSQEGKTAENNWIMVGTDGGANYKCCFGEVMLRLFSIDGTNTRVSGKWENMGIEQPDGTDESSHYTGGGYNTGQSNVTSVTFTRFNTSGSPTDAWKVWVFKANTA